MCKVCHLSTVHGCFSNRIFHKQCKTLSQAGYSVTYIVQHECDEEIDGIKIRMLSKPNNRMDRMIRLNLSTLKLALEENAETYHFHDPELISIGILLKLMGKKVIYDVHEDYKASIAKKRWIHSSLRNLVANAFSFIESFSANTFDGIVAATPQIARQFASPKTVVVQNFPQIENFNPSVEMPYEKRGAVITYIGGMSVLRGAREMLEAVSLLPHALQWQLHIAGSVQDKELEQYLNKLPGWKNTLFYGWQSRQFVDDLLSKSKVGLVLFHPAPNHTMSQPNKLFEYMMAGIPVVASNFPLWREIVDGAKCGITVDPLNVEEISEAVKWLLVNPAEAKAMGERGKRAIYDRYNWHNEGEKLINLYKRIAG